ncbi:MAG: hypothetical protein KC594_17405, partial [Nitrospira sp.]|nr:hypothetical protein [Nitrospira sp.]
MPHDNNFQHSKYSRTNPGERVLYPVYQEGKSVGSPGWIAGMGESIDRMIKSGVRGVLFMSGNPYSDLFGSGRLDEVGGLKRGYSRGIPGIESLLSLLRPDSNGIGNADDVQLPLRNAPECWGKLDNAVQDVGNFSSAYINAFQGTVDSTAQGSLRVARYLWSNVNHHLGRAKAVLELLEYLEDWAKEQSFQPNERLLVQAHGHAGQLLSILSNLVMSEESSNRQILFQVLSAHHDRTGDPDLNPDRLERLYRRLTEQTFLGGAL